MALINAIPDGIFNCFFLFLFLGILGSVVFGVIRASVPTHSGLWKRSRRDDEPPDQEG